VGVAGAPPAVGPPGAGPAMCRVLALALVAATLAVGPRGAGQAAHRQWWWCSQHSRVVAPMAAGHHTALCAGHLHAGTLPHPILTVSVTTYSTLLARETAMLVPVATPLTGGAMSLQR